MIFVKPNLFVFVSLLLLIETQDLNAQLRVKKTVQLIPTPVVNVFPYDRGGGIVGIEIDYRIAGKMSIIANGQVQIFRNDLDGNYVNELGSLGFSPFSRVLLSMQYSGTKTAHFSKINFTSGVLGLKLGQNHDLFVIIGSQPRLLLCSGNINFLRPEFKGIELRWTTQF